MLSNKIFMLIDKLHDLSNRGKISWHEGVDEGSFIADFPDFSIKVGKQRRKTGFYQNVGLSLSVFDESGQVIDQVDEQDFDGISNQIVAREYKVKLSDTFDIARRMSKGTEKKLDNLLSTLENL